MTLSVRGCVKDVIDTAVTRFVKGQRPSADSKLVKAFRAATKPRREAGEVSSEVEADASIVLVEDSGVAAQKDVS